MMGPWCTAIGTRDSGLGTRKERIKGQCVETPRRSIAAAALQAARAAQESGSCHFDATDHVDSTKCSTGSTPESRVPGPECRLSKGFTLIEVLAAIALLAIAFAVSLGALGKSAQNAARSAALDTAVERAQTLLAEQGLAAPLKPETLSGRFADGTGWTLEVHAVSRAPAASGDAGMAAVPPQGGVMMAQASAVEVYQLDVAVQYGGGRTLRLSTQRAQAAGSGDSGFGIGDSEQP